MSPVIAKPLIGAHVSVSGGVDKAIGRGLEIGCTAIQIFTRNASRWQSKPLEEQVIENFRSALSHSSIGYVSSHDSYLINLATPDEQLRAKSIDAFVDEMVRCSQLGVVDLVMHPGAHMKQGVEPGVRRVAESFCSIFQQAPQGVRVLLETTAGQGTTLGARFEELAQIMDLVPEHNFGICFDTCHVHVAGYDLSTDDAYQATMTEFERIVGCDNIALFHANDSKKELGSRVDRHAHLGEGYIGREGFKALMQDRRFTDVAKIIELPGGEGHCHDLANLALLRTLGEEK